VTIPARRDSADSNLRIRAPLVVRKESSSYAAQPPASAEVRLLRVTAEPRAARRHRKAREAA